MSGNCGGQGIDPGTEEAAGSGSLSGISGKTPSELRQQATFVGWDFTNIWGINAAINNGFPYLRGLTDNITSRFQDPNFRAAIYELIGKNTSLPILFSDVDTITRLNLSGGRLRSSLRSEETFIRSLDGIEHLIALRFLDVSNNQIAEIDLSNNVLLEHLDIRGNQLTTLDLSNNTSLEFLNVSGNKIASISDIKGLENTEINLDEFDLGEQNTSISNPLKQRRIAPFAFAGISNGQINLRLQAGNYTAELYNLQGRLIGKTEINATNGINATGLRTDNLSRGVFILNVKQAGNSVLRQKISIK